MIQKHIPLVAKSIDFLQENYFKKIKTTRYISKGFNLAVHREGIINVGKHHSTSLPNFK